MDLELSPREKELAQRAREFCAPGAGLAEEDEHGELPWSAARSGASGGA